MSTVPQLPAEISSDGREVWDWADRLSDAVHRADEIKRRRIQIHNMESQCGNCRYWWSNDCPREIRDGKGRSKGPSSQAPKCSKFDMKPWDRERLEDAKAELAVLEGKPAPSAGTCITPSQGAEDEL